MTIGWYIHHQGSGHLSRFLAVQPHLSGLTAFSTLSAPPGFLPDRWVTLSPDTPGCEHDESDAGGVLHWAPLGHAGLRRRMAQIARWVERYAPQAFVVDVSVEVALLVRLMGVPVIWIAQRGRRNDQPHTSVYAAASAILAPWTTATQNDEHGGPMPRGTRFLGAISRFDGRPRLPVPDARRVLVLAGRGGSELRLREIRRAAQATPDWQWTIDAAAHGQLTADGVWTQLSHADVVVATGGMGLISEVAAARRPLICLPQPRPFDEQILHARALREGGLCDACESWPPSHRWPGLLDRAVARDPGKWRVLHDGLAGPRFAEAIRSVACG